jgi:hypothetical protein
MIVRVLSVQTGLANPDADPLRNRQVSSKLRRKPDDPLHRRFVKLSQSPKREQRRASIGVGLLLRSRQDQFLCSRVWLDRDPYPLKAELCRRSALEWPRL